MFQFTWSYLLTLPSRKLVKISSCVGYDVIESRVRRHQILNIPIWHKRMFMIFHPNLHFRRKYQWAIMNLLRSRTSHVKHVITSKRPQFQCDYGKPKQREINWKKNWPEVLCVRFVVSTSFQPISASFTRCDVKLKERKDGNSRPTLITVDHFLKSDRLNLHFASTWYARVSGQTEVRVFPRLSFKKGLGRSCK